MAPMSLGSLNDVFPLILKLRSQYHEQCGDQDVEAFPDFCVHYLSNLELFSPHFDSLGIVRAGKVLLREHMMKDGEIVQNEVVISDFLKKKGVEPVKAAVLSLIEQLKSNVQLCDFEITDAKKRKRNFFEEFNFDDLPPYEPIELHLDNLKCRRSIDSSLSFVLSADINDFRGHYGWLELMESLKGILKDLPDKSVAVLSIFYRYLHGFREERQSIDVLEVVLDYLATAWVPKGTVEAEGGLGPVRRMEFLLFSTCVATPLSLLMEIPEAQSSGILKKVLLLLSKSSVTWNGCTVPARSVFLLQPDGRIDEVLKFSNSLVDFLRKFGVDKMVRACEEAELIPLFLQDFGARDRLNAAQRFFCGQVILAAVGPVVGNGDLVCRLFQSNVSLDVLHSRIASMLSSCSDLLLAIVSDGWTKATEDSLRWLVHQSFVFAALASSSEVEISHRAALGSGWRAVLTSQDADMCECFIAAFDHLLDSCSVKSSRIATDLAVAISDEVSSTQHPSLLRLWTKLLHKHPQEMPTSALVVVAKLVATCHSVDNRDMTRFQIACCETDAVLSRLQQEEREALMRQLLAALPALDAGEDAEAAELLEAVLRLSPSHGFTSDDQLLLCPLLNRLLVSTPDDSLYSAVDRMILKFFMALTEAGQVEVVVAVYLVCVPAVLDAGAPVTGSAAAWLVECIAQELDGVVSLLDFAILRILLPVLRSGRAGVPEDAASRAANKISELLIA